MVRPKPHYINVPVGVSSTYFLSASFPVQKDYKMSPSTIRHEKVGKCLAYVHYNMSVVPYTGKDIAADDKSLLFLIHTVSYYILILESLDDIVSNISLCNTLLCVAAHENGTAMNTDSAQVREFIERLVETLVSGELDDVKVNRAYTHPECE